MSRQIIRYSTNNFYLGLEYAVLLFPFFFCYGSQKYIQDKIFAWWLPVLIWAILAFLAMIAGHITTKVHPLSLYQRNTLNNGGRLLYCKNSYPQAVIIIAIDSDYVEDNYEKKKSLQNILMLSSVYVLEGIFQIAYLSVNKLILIGLITQTVLLAICILGFNCRFSPLKVFSHKVIAEKQIKEKVKWESVV